MKPYELRDYETSDFADPALFRKEKCSVCGHHLPQDQSIKVGKDWVHTDVRICLALINKSGTKI